MRRIFVDIEFKNLPWTGHSEPLWIGLADDEGNSWSAINADVAIDEFASAFTRDVVVPRMTSDEPRLSPAELDIRIRSFCGTPDEFWAWCPTVDTLRDVFHLGDEAPAMLQLYWDWDFQLLRRMVRPWPTGWPARLRDLNAAARAAAVDVPPNEAAHHPGADALWNRRVRQLIDAAEAERSS